MQAQTETRGGGGEEDSCGGGFLRPFTTAANPAWHRICSSSAAANATNATFHSGVVSGLTLLTGEQMDTILEGVWCLGLVRILQPQVEDPIKTRPLEEKSV